MNFRESIKNRYLRFTTFKWIVGVAEFNPDTILDSSSRLKIHWIKNCPRESWFADPFILSETNDHLNILVEEYFYSSKKGRISKLVVNRHTWRLEQIIPVIDISTHLSFPAYFRQNGKVYIYPESTKSGKLTLYEYDEKGSAAIPVKEISSYPLADAVIYDRGDKTIIMATTAPNDNGKVLDVYPHSDEPSARPESRISFPTNVARNAGIPFRVGNHTIRPAQDCTRSYGSCVVLQEMTYKKETYYFEEVRRLRSPRFTYKEAFHTFNVFENRLVAVDAEGFRYGLVAQLVYHIRESIRK